jgi:hypothetical protein
MRLQGILGTVYLLWNNRVLIVLPSLEHHAFGGLTLVYLHIFGVDLSLLTSTIHTYTLDNQKKMNRDLVAAISKLSILGQNSIELIDCSDVIPVPKPLPPRSKSAAFPNGGMFDDIEVTVRECFVTAGLTDLIITYR